MSSLFAKHLNVLGTAVLVKAYTGQMGETQLLPLSPGMHFGEIELYHPRYGRGVRICSAISKTYCELTFLSRQVISHIGIFLCTEHVLHIYSWVVGETWPEILAHFEHTGDQKIRYMAKRGPLEEFNLGVKPMSTNGLRHRRFSMSGVGWTRLPLRSTLCRVARAAANPANLACTSNPERTRGRAERALMPRKCRQWKTSGPTTSRRLRKMTTLRPSRARNSSMLPCCGSSRSFGPSSTSARWTEEPYPLVTSAVC